MKTNWVQKQLQARQSTIGCIIGLGSPSVSELLSDAGLYQLVVET